MYSLIGKTRHLGLRFFSSFIMRIAYWRTKSFCVLRQCRVNRKKSPRNTIWKLKTLQNWTALPNGATCILRQYISAGNNIPSLVFPRCTQQQNQFKKRKRRKKFAAFCLFVKALPIDFALQGRKRKYIKSKTTAKLREKRKSIAAVRDIQYLERLAPSRPPFFLVTDYLHCKLSSSKKLTWNGTLRHVFICRRPTNPPPLTHCVCV
jgi:hypothetical protein